MSLPGVSRIISRTLSWGGDASTPARRRGDGAYPVPQAGVGAVLVRPDPLVLDPQSALSATLALRYRLPAIYPWTTIPGNYGGLMSYNVSILDLHRRSASYVDRILKDAKPSDLPVEQPTKFEMVINLKTAKALGLAIPTCSSCGRTR